jgi:hypothetical protein
MSSILDFIAIRREDDWKKCVAKLDKSENVSAL